MGRGKRKLARGLARGHGQPWGVVEGGGSDTSAIPYTHAWEYTKMRIREMGKETRAQAISSIQRYFEENMTEPIGQLPAGQLFEFFMEEFGPIIYNQAISDAQARMQQCAVDLNGELYADEFQYWVTRAARRKGQKA